MTIKQYISQENFELILFSIFIIESLISVVTLLVLNIISVIRWKIVKNVLRSTTHATGYTSSKMKATKLIILLTCVCIVTRALDCLVSILYRLRVGSVIYPTEEQKVFLKLLKAISYFLLFAAHALDGILYYYYDRPLRDALANLWDHGCYQ